MKVVDVFVKKLKHPFRSSSKGQTKAHLRTGEKGAALTMTPSAKIEPHQEIMDEAYAAGWARAMAESTKDGSRPKVPSPVSSPSLERGESPEEKALIVTSSPLENDGLQQEKASDTTSPLLERDESQQDKSLNLTGLPKGHTGDYTDEYGPTSQFAVEGSIGAHDLGVMANSRPAYEEDASVKQGQGYFFKPREADIGQIPGEMEHAQGSFPKITTKPPHHEESDKLEESAHDDKDDESNDSDPERSLDPKAEHKANKSLYNKGGVHAAMKEILNDSNTQFVNPHDGKKEDAASGKKDERHNNTKENQPATEAKESSISPEEGDAPQFQKKNGGSAQVEKSLDYEELEHKLDAEIAKTQAEIEELKDMALTGQEVETTGKQHSV